MPQGDKSSYSSKQKRMAEHIEDSYDDRGARKKDAERIAWATVNKETGGAHGLRKSSQASGGRAKTKSTKSSLFSSTRGTKSRRSTGTKLSRTSSASRKKSSR